MKLQIAEIEIAAFRRDLADGSFHARELVLTPRQQMDLLLALERTGDNATFLKLALGAAVIVIALLAVEAFGK